MFSLCLASMAVYCILYATNSRNIHNPDLQTVGQELNMYCACGAGCTNHSQHHKLANMSWDQYIFSSWHTPLDLGGALFWTTPETVTVSGPYFFKIEFQVFISCCSLYSFMHHIRIWRDFDRYCLTIAGTKATNATTKRNAIVLRDKMSPGVSISLKVKPACTAIMHRGEMPMNVAGAKIQYGISSTGDEMFINQLGTTGEIRRNRTREKRLPYCCCSWTF